MIQHEQYIKFVIIFYNNKFNIILVFLHTKTLKISHFNVAVCLLELCSNSDPARAVCLAFQACDPARAVCLAFQACDPARAVCLAFQACDPARAVCVY